MPSTAHIDEKKHPQIDAMQCVFIDRQGWIHYNSSLKGSLLLPELVYHYG